MLFAASARSTFSAILCLDGAGRSACGDARWPAHAREPDNDDPDLSATDSSLSDVEADGARIWRSQSRSALKRMPGETGIAEDGRTTKPPVLPVLLWLMDVQMRVCTQLVVYSTSNVVGS